MRTLLVGLTAVALLFAPMRGACAQGSDGFSIDATIGAGQASGGGPLGKRDYAAGDVLFAVGRWSPSVSSTLFALALSAQGQLVDNDCLLLPGGQGCLAHFPDLVSAGILVGRSHGLPLGSSVAVLGGPGIYFAEGREAAVGLQARVDLASAVKAHAAFVVSLRGAYLPNLRGDGYLPVAVGVGVRFQ